MMYYRIVGFILLCLCFATIPNSGLSQETAYPINKDRTERILTPSPVASGLGTYGGVQLKKNAGGVQKRIPLFSVSNGGLTYAPSIEYYSTGVKVDDWGGRVGISWSENFSGSITRIVKGVADELATSRLSDPPNTLYDATSATLNTVTAVANANSTSGKDGEFDEFSINAFDVNANFIIKDGQAVLLNHQEGLKIEISHINPYEFIVTQSNGNKFFFGQNATYETVVFNTDNLCESDYSTAMPVATAWYLTKIESPEKDQINFQYQQLSVGYYIYDYTESYLLKNGPDAGDIIPPCADLSDELYMYENNYCVRRKRATSQCLQTVTADNFTVQFTYDNRADLEGEKLIQGVELKNSAGLSVKKYGFFYDRVFASSVIENKIQINLEDAEEDSRLKTRYFLGRLISDNGSGAQVHDFSYLNPQLLPHRFSFGQDYGGHYNGHSGTAFLSAKHVSLFRELYPSFRPDRFVQPIYATNREPNDLSSTGMLNKIVYPTGGIDTLIYEPNVMTFTKENKIMAVFTETLTNGAPNAPVSGAASQTITVPLVQSVSLTISCKNSDPGSMIPENDYFLQYYLRNMTDGQLLVSSGLVWVGQTITISPELLPDKEYELEYDYTGVRTFGDYRLDYYSGITYDLTNQPWLGCRLKKSITKSDEMTTPVEKTYDYRSFVQQGNKLVFSDSSSLVSMSFDVPSQTLQLPYLMDYTWIQKVEDCSISTPTSHLKYYHLLSRPHSQMYIYGGTPYAYACVTEFVGDGAKQSFTASNFAVVNNNPGGALWGVESQSAISNSGWRHGLELATWLGTRSGTDNVILKELSNKYSAQPPVTFNNYSSRKLYTATGGDIEGRLNSFSFSHYPLYSRWFKLDSVMETDYSDQDGIVMTMKKKREYEYDITDKLIKTISSRKSNNKIFKQEFLRPRQMVAAGRDPDQVYADMVTLGMVDPEVETNTYIDGNLTERLTTAYHKTEHDLYLPLKTEVSFLQGPAKTVREYRKYDDRGNPLWIVDDKGINHSYIWSYNKQYAIAEIKNATYTQVSALLGETAVSQFAGQSNPSVSAVASFVAPLRTSLAAAQVRSFAFNPLVGMTMQQDVNERNLHYQYDNDQRLVAVLDHDLNVLKTFKYNYARDIPPPATGNIDIKLLNQTTQTFSITLMDMNTGDEFNVIISPGENYIVSRPVGSFTLRMPFNIGFINGDIRVMWDCQELATEDWIVDGNEMYLDDYYMNAGDCEYRIQFLN